MVELLLLLLVFNDFVFIDFMLMLLFLVWFLDLVVDFFLFYFCIFLLMVFRLIVIMVFRMIMIIMMLNELMVWVDGLWFWCVFVEYLVLFLVFIIGWGFLFMGIFCFGVVVVVVVVEFLFRVKLGYIKIIKIIYRLLLCL